MWFYVLEPTDLHFIASADRQPHQLSDMDIFCKVKTLDSSTPNYKGVCISLVTGLNASININYKNVMFNNINIPSKQLRNT